MLLSLSITQDDKGRRRWTFFGGSEQEPARPFWKSFYTLPKKEMPAARALSHIGAILNAAYGEIADFHHAGFRIFAKEGDLHKMLRPSWTNSLIWTNGMSLLGTVERHEDPCGIRVP